MQEVKIEQAVIAIPAVNDNPAEEIIVKEIELLQYVAGNQTLVQDNGGLQRDAVTLAPEQLLELIRHSEEVLRPLRDEFIAKAKAIIFECVDMIRDRKSKSTNALLIAKLDEELDKLSKGQANAKSAFYSYKHDLFMAGLTGYKALLVITFNNEALRDDDALFAAWNMTASNGVLGRPETK